MDADCIETILHQLKNVFNVESIELTLSQLRSRVQVFYV